MNKHNTKKTETLYLWWLCEKTAQRKPAGVAFFDTEFGDYRLKLDFFPQAQYYLRCLGTENDTITYRLEVVHKSKEGRFLRRVCVGNGRALTNMPHEVRIDPFPFDRTLLLTLKEKKETVAA